MVQGWRDQASSAGKRWMYTEVTLSRLWKTRELRQATMAKSTGPEELMKSVCQAAGERERGLRSACLSA